jgi:hypothetical protein
VKICDIWYNNIYITYYITYDIAHDIYSYTQLSKWVQLPPCWVPMLLLGPWLFPASPGSSAVGMPATRHGTRRRPYGDVHENICILYILCIYILYLILYNYLCVYKKYTKNIYCIYIYICDYMCVCEFLYLFIRIYIRYRGIQWYDVLTPTKEYPPNNKGLRANRNQPLLGVIFAWEWFGVVVYVLYLHLGNLNK